MRKTLLTLVVCFSVASPVVLANDLFVSLADIPTPGFSRFLDEMAKHHEGGSFSYKKYPFPRSVRNAIVGTSNFHMPLLANPFVSEKQLPYIYSTESFAKVAFVIYSNHKKKLSREMLENPTYRISDAFLRKSIFPKSKEGELRVLLGEHSSWLKLGAQFKSILGEDFWSDNREEIGKSLYPYKIETEPNHVDFFDFPTIPMPRPEGALKKVNASRIDGYILAQEECDSIVKTNHLRNIHRAFFRIYEAKFIIGRGTSAKRTDEAITKIIKKMKWNGSFEKLSYNIHRAFEEWQPYKSL